MKKAWVDANVILRYLTKDPAKMAEAAFKLFDDAKNGKLSLLLTSLTVAEVVWVLESFYDHSKAEIAQTIAQLLFCDGLEVEDLDLLMRSPHALSGEKLGFR